MRQRRKGLKINVHESEIADAVSAGGIRGAFNYFLKLGFTPTMLADSHAISFGGAALYRNRVNTYIKKGFDRTEAETQAFKDFQRRSEPADNHLGPRGRAPFRRRRWHLNPSLSAPSERTEARDRIDQYAQDDAQAAGRARRRPA